MDEPFSALDVLTAETLRTDMLDLWSDGALPIKGIILVTHNIEEAVFMCDRIAIFGSNPGRILNEIVVGLPHPRNRLDPEFRDYVEQIYAEMTTRKKAEKVGPQRADHFPGMGVGTVLPRISTNLLAGLMESVAGPPYNGRADLPVIASALQFEVDDLFPVAETLQMLRFAIVEGGDIQLTDAGREFAAAETDQRKTLFARHLLSYVALAAHIRRVLDERESHRAPWSRFADELEDHMPPQAAERSLRAAISWGRYAEIYAYDDPTETFSLENP